MKAKEEELRDAMSKTQELLNKVKDVEEKVATLSQEKNDLNIQLQAVRGALREGQELGVLATAQTSRVAMSQAQGWREDGPSENHVPPDYREFPAFSFVHCKVNLDPTTKMPPLNSYLPTATGWARTDMLGLRGWFRPGTTRCGGRRPHSEPGSAVGPQNLPSLPPCLSSGNTAGRTNDLVSMGA